MNLYGQVPSPQPVVEQHFPDRLHTFVWRNWYLVPSERIAKVVCTSEENIRQIAFSMGLPEQPVISEEQLNRSYITIIKHNWHLLPYDQLLKLLDWTHEKLDFILKEDDFLFVKLGRVKPLCDPIIYKPPDAGSIKSEKYIASLLKEEFPEGLELPGEKLFDFIYDFDIVQNGVPSNKSSSGQKIRFCYSYFALYGDPLADTLLNPYPDGYLRQLAASGINGVWLPALLSKLAPFPWDSQMSAGYEIRLKNLANLAERAKQFGIGVYLYLNEPRSMPLNFFDKFPELKGVEEGQFATLCTSNPGVRNYLTDAVAEICKSVPDIAGFLTITASENLTNCCSHGNENKCLRCSKRDPAKVIAEVNKAFFLGIKKASFNSGGKYPDVYTRPKLIVWDWGWKDTWTKRIISSLPEGVSLMCVSEWGIPIERGGIRSNINEYCLSAIGPGEKAKQEWKWALKNKLGIFAKIQANITWELSSVPYLPVVENVAIQAKNLIKEETTGIMAGWTLGGYPSPNLEVLKEISDNPCLTPDEGMLGVAQKRYGKAAAPFIVNAWVKYSRAFNKFPFQQSVVYHAPLQTGPANLLWPSPTGFKSSMVGFPYDDLDGWRGSYPVQTFIDQLDSVAIGFDEANIELQTNCSGISFSPGARLVLNDDINFITVASIHYRSAANQARFVDLRNKLGKTFNPDSVGEILNVLKKTLTDEINLAKRLYYIQSRDSRIGFEASNQYYYIPGDLIEKVINCHYLLDFWLPEMQKKYISEAKVNDIKDQADNGSENNFKLGPVTELKWDYGPVSLGMVMDMSMVSLSDISSQDLLISRIWQGLFIYPSNSFPDRTFLKQPYFLGKAGALMFQPVDWNNDGIIDLVAADRDGFLYLIQGEGVFPDIHYEKSSAAIIRDASNNLPFNIPQENPNFPRQDDLGGYSDVQYLNYVYPEIYVSAANNKFKDLILGDGFGNLWWLPDNSDGTGRPSYSGIKYSKEKSSHAAGIQYQKEFGLDYVKPAEKICDENGEPFLLGTGKEAKKFFRGANTRPVIYPDESGIPGLLVISGTNLQQIFYLKRINPLMERKPVFRNMGEVHISGLESTILNFHSKLCLFENNGRKDLLLSSVNYLAILENAGWQDGVPKFTFHNWICGPDAPASGYVFNEMLIDNPGKRYIIDFANNCWKLIPVEIRIDGIRLHYTDSLLLQDQNGIFRVEGETDPQFSPEWGYHRISRWDFDGSGRQHLIVTTDKGLLYLLEDDPILKKPEKFIFRSFGPLKDSKGNIIKIHNRAAAGGIDLNGDGREDLIVGGISYQLGIKSDPQPGGGVYYMINSGVDSKGLPVLSPPEPLDLGPDFKPRINSHIGLQVLDLDNDNEKEVIISLQDPGWGGRIYRKLKDKIGLYYTGSKVPLEPIIEQIIDIDGDTKFEIVRPGDESGVGFYRKLIK